MSSLEELESRISKLESNSHMNLSEIVNRNAAAFQSAIDEFEKRISALEEGHLRTSNQVQTLIGMVTQLQQTNNLALAQLRGTGATTVGPTG